MSRFRTPIHRELNRGLRDVVGADSASELARLGLFTLGDLLRHVPRIPLWHRDERLPDPATR